MWTLHKLNVAKRKRLQDHLPEETASPGPRREDLMPAPKQDDLPELLKDGAEPVPGKLSSPWDFSQEELRRFPALQKRNFWCIQRHQARGAHPLTLNSSLGGYEGESS
jgi:hypothetical protein